jgi:hypothetical protein
MTKFKISGILILLLAILACNGSDVTRPADVNDEDAIYHIIIYDRQAEFNMDLLDFSIPDTLIEPLIPDILDYYWFDLNRDSLDLFINIDYPDIQDSLGTLPEGDVSYTKLFYGTLEIIGADSIGGEEIPVRRSKPFIIRAEILARFVKFGSDNNFRRGWLLRYISNVVYSANYPQGISQITVNSASNPDYILPAGIIPLADIPTFTPGESLTVTISGSNPDFIAGFTMPQNAQFNHFLVEVIREASLDDNNIFGYEAVGVLFEVE